MSQLHTTRGGGGGDSGQASRTWPQHGGWRCARRGKFSPSPGAGFPAAPANGCMCLLCLDCVWLFVLALFGLRWGRVFGLRVRGLLRRSLVSAACVTTETALGRSRWGKCLPTLCPPRPGYASSSLVGGSLVVLSGGWTQRVRRGGGRGASWRVFPRFPCPLTGSECPPSRPSAPFCAFLSRMFVVIVDIESHWFVRACHCLRQCGSVPGRCDMVCFLCG